MSFIENSLEKIELGIWYISCIPGLNSPAGLLKCNIGIVQIIAGLAVSIIAKVSLNEVVAERGAKHIVHGLINITAGFVLLIPIIGNIFAIYFVCSKEHVYSYNNRLADGLLN
ncbi:MAG: hypothetical protein BGO10_06950 [Chlamydia sp. 32-24]|nr:MAG: hypothetical protein BGO10_06950 [Chlamydia sp. 32-24]